MTGRRRGTALAAVLAAALLAGCDDGDEQPGDAVGDVQAGIDRAITALDAWGTPWFDSTVTPGQEVTASVSQYAYSEDPQWQPSHTVAVLGYPSAGAAAGGERGKVCSGTLMGEPYGELAPYALTSGECLFGDDGARLHFFTVLVSMNRAEGGDFTVPIYTCTTEESFTSYDPTGTDLHDREANYGVVVPTDCMHYGWPDPQLPDDMLLSMGSTRPTPAAPGRPAYVTGYPSEHTEALAQPDEFRGDHRYRMWQYGIESLDLTQAELAAPVVRIYGIGTKGAISGAPVTQLCYSGFGDCLIGVVTNGGGAIDDDPDFIEYRTWDAGVEAQVAEWTGRA